MTFTAHKTPDGVLIKESHQIGPDSKFLVMPSRARAMSLQIVSEFKSSAWAKIVLPLDDVRSLEFSGTQKEADTFARQLWGAAQ